MSPIGEPQSLTRKRADNVLRHVIAPAIERLGLAPVRADEIAEPGAINRQILTHVLTARATIADLTEANPNVYYELAVRHSAGLPVVLVARDGTRLPFDLHAQRTVFFDETDLESAANATEQIFRQLSHALKSEDQRSPVLEVADLQMLNRAGAEQRRIAELVDIIEALDATAIRQFAALEQLSFQQFETIERSLRRLPVNPERLHNVRAVLRTVVAVEESARPLVEAGASKEQIAQLLHGLKRARNAAETALMQVGVGAGFDD
jgi:hypothetical protein